MTLEANNNAATTEDDLKTTVPNMQSPKWKMPEPVFRKTSGRLPRPLENKADAAAALPEASSILDSATPASTFQTPEPKPKSPALKIVVVVLAIAAMIAFITVFLTVVYFSFLR